MLQCNHPAHHLRLAGALVVQGEAAGVVAEVPGPHGSDSQTELGAGALTVYAVDPAGLMDVNIVLGPGHLRRGINGGRNIKRRNSHRDRVVFVSADVTI